MRFFPSTPPKEAASGQSQPIPAKLNGAGMRLSGRVNLREIVVIQLTGRGWPRRRSPGRLPFADGVDISPQLPSALQGRDYGD
jgi:hypothetical protein